MLEIKLLLLLMVANGAPVVAWDIFKERYDWPVDWGITLSDGSPLFGPAKTWRGATASVLITPLVAMSMSLTWKTGFIIAAMAMAGDLLSSFCKRRLGIQASGQALGLDQIPESLLPLLVIKKSCGLAWDSIVLVSALFFILEISLSPVLYRLGIRKRPY